MATPTTGYDANIADEVVVGGGGGGRSEIMVPLKGGADTANNPLAGKGESKAKAAVAWDSDNNSFFIVATRQQHQWVEAYLESLDRPQQMVGLEVKFFESSRDPRSELGMDWSGYLQGGIPFSATGLTAGAPLNLNESLKPQWKAPTGVLLSTKDFQTRLLALSKDSQSDFTSYPRMLTLNNRPVTIQSVVNQPLLASTSSVSGGLGGTSTTSVAYMPVGTSIVMVPKVVDGSKVNINVQIIVSSITGTEIIGTNKYPVPSTRVFQSQLQVENGYTVAIAGLDEAMDSRSGTGVPLLSRVPLLGWAFKSQNHERSKKHMMIFITPTIMDASGNGISEKPISELPRFKGDLPMDAPKIYPDGTLAGGPAKLGDAIGWVDQHRRKLNQIVVEGRATDEHRAQISRLDDVVEALNIYLPAVSGAFQDGQAAGYRSQLERQRSYITSLKGLYREKQIYGLGYDRYRR